MEKIDVKIMVIESDTWQNVLKIMGDYLYENDYVKETYTNAVIEREKTYPTGLEIPNAINVAIPHADIEHVKKQALLIGILKNPVKFFKMDDPSKQVNVELILMTVINDPKGYIKFLSKLTTLIRKEEFIKLAKKHDYDSIIKLIQEECL
jgi:PTS system galactitol-specific IIA component